MKKLSFYFIAVAVLLSVSANLSQAQIFKLSLWDDICVPNETKTTGLELAVGTQTEDVEGVQFALIYAQAGKICGLQTALVSNADNGCGLQWSFVNLGHSFQGAQLSAVNWSDDVKGLQLGWVNNAEAMNGLQLGFVNITGQMKGLQIGLVNIIKNNPEFFPVFPFFNFCF